jgi:homogentisate 1,2-dioxygenase
MRYHQMGRVPQKRHVQFRDPEHAGSNGNAPLLVEEVLGFEGFSGNESILYHLQSPCRIAEAGEHAPIEHAEWTPDAHVHRHLETGGIAAQGDPITGRRAMMWNGDLEVSLCRPESTTDAFFRNGEGDEVFFVHRGSGTLETIFGRVPFREHDYVVVPRGTT